MSQRDTSQWEVYFPFNLSTNRGALSDPAKIDALKSLFPGTTTVEVDNTFLYFYFSEALPPKPWPGRIAGLPPYFTLGDFGTSKPPLPPLRHSHPENGRLGEAMDGRDMEDWEPLFRLVREYFQIMQVAITEVMYWRNFLIIVLERQPVNGTKLPFAAGRIPCYYLEEECMCRPAAAALHSRTRLMTSPGIDTGGTPRKTEYYMPGPGVRVSPLMSPGNPKLYTPTGTPVAAAGEYGTTVASPDPDRTPPYPSEGRELHHATAKPGNNGYGGTTGLLQKSPAINRLVPGQPVWLGSAAACLVPVTYMHSSRQRVASDDPSAPGCKWMWVKTMWVYGGQDSPWEPLADWLRGSVIWTENGDAVGCFRDMMGSGPMKDWGFGHCSG